VDKKSLIRTLQAAGISLAIALALPASAQSRGLIVPQSIAPDDTLYATFYFDPGYHNATLVVCGSTKSSDGCYGSAILGPFGRVGSIIEGNQVVSGNQVTRSIYVVDEAAGNGTAVKLSVYRKTDIVTAYYDTTTVKLLRTIALPLSGGVQATTFMAANAAYLYVGTNQSTSAVRIRKSDLAMASIGGFSPPMTVSSIASDSYGHVSVTFGSVQGPNAFYVFGRQGNFKEDGGGADVLVGTQEGLSTTGLVTSNSIQASRMQVHFHARPAGH
jgi:hypothetical protein